MENKRIDDLFYNARGNENKLIEIFCKEIAKVTDENFIKYCQVSVIKRNQILDKVKKYYN